MQAAIGLGIPVPAHELVAGLLRFLPGAPACRPNLTQAQRDFFGAHTYRRVDRDGVFHTDWTGDGTDDKGSDTH